MKQNFDIAIIGGGLAGLACGITAAKKGKKCAIISTGPSALSFSSGSFDLFNALPDGSALPDTLEAVNELSENHPYKKLGAENFEGYAWRAENFLRMAGVQMNGSYKKPHYRITSAGNFSKTWLSANGLLTLEDKNVLPFKSAAIFSPAGFLDFYPSFIAEQLESKGVSTEKFTFYLRDKKPLKRIPFSLLIGRGHSSPLRGRRAPIEMRSVNVAERFDRNIPALAKIINRQKSNSEVVLIPALVGLSENMFEALKSKVKKPIYMIATMPPSVPGVIIENTLKKAFLASGGTFIENKEVAGSTFNGAKVESVFYEDDIVLADKFVLATGGFFSKGLKSTLDTVKENIFDLDISFSEEGSAVPEREQWFSKKVLETQPYMKFGVRTDNNFKAIKNGHALENLYVIGAGLEGFNALDEGCGAGVSLLTGLHVGESL